MISPFPKFSMIFTYATIFFHKIFSHVISYAEGYAFFQSFKSTFIAMKIPQSLFVTFRMVGVLIIGSGGREHALAWKLAQSVDRVRVAPGNASPFGSVGGLIFSLYKCLAVSEKLANNNPIKDYERPLNSALDIDDPEAILAYCSLERLEMVVIGPEVPLSKGIVDRLQDRIAVFGPTQDAAMLEVDVVTCEPNKKDFIDF